MSYLKASYLELEQCCKHFSRGVELLEQCLVEESQGFFKLALEQASERHPLYCRYQSYYGLVSILNGETAAIALCREAALIAPFDGDVCMNLVRAELFLSNRVNAVRSIEIGLRFSSAHPGLQTLKTRVGFRQRNPLPLLARENFLNRLIGRCLRRKKAGG